MTDGTHDPPAIPPGSGDADPIHLIRETLARLRFGGIQLTVHEGKLVQTEITEKPGFS